MRMSNSRGGSRGSRGKQGGGSRRDKAPRGGTRREKEVLPRGVKKRHLERVDNYEYELPENFQDEDLEEGIGGYDVWDEPKDGDYDSDISGVSGVDEDELITIDQLWDQSDSDDDSLSKLQEADQSASDVEEDIDEDTHSQLVDQIKDLNKFTAAAKTRKNMEIIDKRVESEHNIDLMDRDDSSVSIQNLISHLTPESTNKLKQMLKSHNVEARVDTLLPPMAHVDQARMERTVAYKRDKVMMTDKWEDIVEQNRRSSQIDLVDRDIDMVPKKTDALLETFKPTSDFEKELASVLEASGQDVTTAPKYDELPVNALTPAQVAMQTAEIRRMKSLMTYQIQKNTRINKIRSKTYRRIHKKANQIKEEKALMDYLATNPEAAAEEVQKMELQRIEERMSLRHKNTSQWVRDNLKRGKNIDPVSRQAIDEQLARGRELTKKMATMDSEDEEEDDFDKPEFNIDEEDPDLEPEPFSEDEQRRRRLAKLTGDPNIQIPTKGLFAVKFMKRAMDRSLTEAESKLSHVDDYDEGEKEAAEVETLDQPRGRRIIGHVNPTTSVLPASKHSTIQGELAPQVSGGHKARVEGPITTGREARIKRKAAQNNTDKTSAGEQETTTKNTPPNKKSKISVNEDKSNPWMEGTEYKKDTCTDETLLTEPGRAELPAKNKKAHSTVAELPIIKLHQDVAKVSKKGGKTKLAAKVIPTALNDIADTREIVRTNSAKDEGEDSDGDVDDEQAELLRRAFEEDNIVEEFTRENDKKTSESVSLALPGWGSWASSANEIPAQTKRAIKTQNESAATLEASQRHSTKQQQQQQQQQQQPQKQQKQPQRVNNPTQNTKTTNENIQITNNTAKKNNTGKVHMKVVETKAVPVVMHKDSDKTTVPDKYKVKKLPAIASSEEEFTKQILTPIGKEWTPVLAHSTITAPKVITKAGHPVAPISLTGTQEQKYKEKSDKYMQKYHKTK